VPTHNDILVPETLLKKRKSQEKEREARATELQKKRQVGTHFMSDMFGRKIVVMISTNYAD
jgi:large subunit ribosomal protein L7e